MKLKLLPKFMISLVILGAVLTVSISFFCYYSTKGFLEDMYARRVTSGSRIIAKMISVQDVKTVISENGDSTSAYAEMTALFEDLKYDGQITYLSLVVPHEDSVTFYIDACVEKMGDDPANQIAYGSDIPYTEAAYGEEDLQKYYEIWEMYAKNEGTRTPLVTDNSYGYNYTAVCPVLDESGNAIAEVQYIMDMQEVRDYLNSLLYTMTGISAGVIVAAIFCYILFVKKNVLSPIGKLVEFTDGITAESNFHNQSIDLATGDEIEALGCSFNYMLAELDRYIVDFGKVMAEKERIGAELSIATHIQSSMLPCIFPAFPDRKEFDVYAVMNPAKEVGGDFYDFFMVDERHVAVVMADVSGKGVPAALFMVIGKTLIKDHTQPGKKLGDVFSDVNNLLCSSNSEGLFITAFEGVLDLVTGEFAYVNAGHEVPCICRKEGNYEPYKVRPGFVLAGMEDMRYQEGSVRLEPGDKVFLYTDGVPEATNAENEMYGNVRMLAALNRNKDKMPQELLSEMKADVDRFAAGISQFDDITMLCLEYKETMKEGEQ